MASLPSDLIDAEWGIVAPMIPPGRHGGRRRSVNVREVLNGIFYVLWTGCQLRPPRICRRRARCTTILSSGIGTAPWRRIHHALYGGGAARSATRSKPDGGDHRLADREGAQKGGLWLILRATNVATSIKGCRHLVDTLGFLLNVVVHPADIQDRDKAPSTCCAGRDDYSRSSNAFLLTADTRDARWR